MDKETEPKFENGYKAEEQENPEYNLATGHNQLERGLKSRHIQFLALGKLTLLSSVCLETHVR